jgi:hypothetical protein
MPLSKLNQEQRLEAIQKLKSKLHSPNTNPHSPSMKTIMKHRYKKLKQGNHFHNNMIENRLQFHKNIDNKHKNKKNIDNINKNKEHKKKNKIHGRR